MKISFLQLIRRKNDKSEANYKQDLLIKLGREQFKRLVERGIELPVVLL